MNHFELFSLPTSFTIDEAALKSKYFELQRQYHPDKIGLEGAQKSMELNQAYQTLGDDLKRAQHFLALQNVDVGHDDSRVKPDMALLEEMMEKREAVMGLESPEAASALLSKAKGEYEQELASFTKLAEELEGDASRPSEPSAAEGASHGRAAGETGDIKKVAAQSLLRLQYITKWQSEIKQQIRKLN